MSEACNLEKYLKTIGGYYKNGPPASPRSAHKRLQDGPRRLENQHRMHVQDGSGLGIDLDPFWVPTWLQLGPKLGPNMDLNRS